MDRVALQDWALAHGWRVLAGHPSLTKPRPPHEPVVRLVLKATVAHVEVKKPAGKWEKLSGAAYASIVPDPETGIPSGLGFETINGFSLLMQDNRDRMVFARMTGGTPG
ncbi:hypothetical protein [Falsiroseomonas selenitidurans]|uniref:Uncharacterized protein n=1 Tax=Falsiroseomonas selenitidurans TaxID=2716335 RepID=A0ABX1EE81_9PROT|nr:hypothetical protein [Falsiroseomonas selenitidurans]NKC34212.1 hypothetical protein [Falsiroseomonas selenitidurans]OYW09226.1 MAG: hypothetical protein B7Z53_03340 [Rhodospirillales bacterium 12-71-4]